MLRAALPSVSSAASFLLAGFVLALGLVEGLAWACDVVPSAGLHAALAVAAYELGVTLALALVPRRSALGPPAVRRVSVLVAAWNEAPVIGKAVRGLLAQDGVELEVIVADDGSTDGTAAAVPHDPRVRVVRIPHAGKGAALEAARRLARHDLVVTVDADTELEPGALAKLASAFADPRVVAAGGAVLVRGTRDAFSLAQLVEYQKTTWTRCGWAALGVLEQIPGAFSAFRKGALELAGGFPLDSLTEDYEITYRIRSAYAGRDVRVVLVPEARAWTEPPRTLPTFVRQRTRWFAGFLSTLFRFRSAIGDRRLGAFGLVRLPQKVLDAVLPLGLLASVALFVAGALSGEPLVSTLGAALLGLRVVEGALVYAVSDQLHVRAAGRGEGEPRRALAWAAAVFDGIGYAWLRSIVVLRAYPFSLSRVHAWERSRPVVRPEVFDAPAE